MKFPPIHLPLPQPVFITKTGFWILLGALFFLLACAPLPLPFASATPTPQPSNQIKVIVRDGGWTRVSADTLRVMGLDLNTVDPARVQVFDGTNEIPARRAREGIEFYAQPSTTPAVALNAYVLKWNQARAKEFEEKNSAPEGTPATVFTATLTLEENPLYIPEATETDRRLWQRLTAPTETNLNVNLPARASGEARAQIVMWSLSQDQKAHPNHHVQLIWNSQTLADVKWDGRAMYTMTATIPPNALRDGDNALKLKLPGDTGALADIVFLDRVKIFYPRKLDAAQDALEFETGAANVTISGLSSADTTAYDLTDPRAPVRLTQTRNDATAITFATNATLRAPRRFLVLGKNATPRAPLAVLPMSNANLRDASTGADEIIIAPPDFVDALKPLAEWRVQHGITARIVTTEQVYNEFSFGRADPVALRAFIAYALDNWKPAPRFILLVGKASQDIYDYQQGPNKNLLPTHLQASPNLGEVANDNWFVATSDTDPTPRAALGRIPAKTSEQVKIVVEKIRAYETQTGEWQQRAVLIADAKETQFSGSVNTLASRLPANIQAKKIPVAATNAELAARRADILREWNAGALLITYIGHGSIDTWAAGPLISAQDLKNLSNRNALPILYTPTCLDGYFYDPVKDSLAEQVLFNPNGGISAGIVPTGLSFPDAQDHMTEQLVRAWFDDRVSTLGGAFQRAKVKMPRDSSSIEVIETFVLLGDPALALLK